MDSTSPLKRKREANECKNKAQSKTPKDDSFGFREKEIIEKLETLEGLSSFIENTRVLLNSCNCPKRQRRALDDLLHYSELKFKLRQKERETQQQTPL